MRTLIALVFHYSVNGLVADEDTEYFRWCFEKLDEHGGPDADAASLEFLRGADLHLMGRSAYDGMAEGLPGSDHPWAAILDAAPKVVFSRTLATAEWAGTTIVSGDTAHEVERIRLGGDGYVVVWGGVRLWQDLVDLDLVDEFRIGLHPYVADEGTRLFDRVPSGYALDLVSSSAADNGVIELHYRRHR